MSSLLPKACQKEADPDGLSSSTPGAKLDAGKNRLGLVLGGFSKALEAVGEVGTYGAIKYSPNGWKSVSGGLERYEDALLRHTFRHLQGELCDPDTHLLHLAHRAWNALATLEFKLQEIEEANNAMVDLYIQQGKYTIKPFEVG